MSQSIDGSRLWYLPVSVVNDGAPNCTGNSFAETIVIETAVGTRAVETTSVFS